MYWQRDFPVHKRRPHTGLKFPYRQTPKSKTPNCQTTSETIIKPSALSLRGGAKKHTFHGKQRTKSAINNRESPKKPSERPRYVRGKKTRVWHLNHSCKNLEFTARLLTNALWNGSRLALHGPPGTTKKATNKRFPRAVCVWFWRAR